METIAGTAELDDVCFPQVPSAPQQVRQTYRLHAAVELTNLDVIAEPCSHGIAK